MSRSKWKAPFFEKKIEKKKCILKRSSEITPVLVNKSVWVHDGKTLKKVEISDTMVGHKAGEFVFTRSEFSFKKKKNGPKN